MATVLQFPAADAERKTIAKVGGAGAQIVFFTGVRYERVDLPEKPKPAKQAKPRSGARELLLAL